MMKKNILNTVLVDNGLNPCAIVNIGDVISGDILTHRQIDIKYEIMDFNSDQSISDDLQNTINEQVFQ